MKTIEKKVAGGYVEATYTLPRPEAREAAKQYLDRYPKWGYGTHVAHWKVSYVAIHPTLMLRIQMWGFSRHS